MTRALLLSNSTNPGEPYLRWPRAPITEFLGTAVRRVLFVPFAGARVPWAEYAGAVRTAFGEMDYQLDSIHEAADALAAVQAAEAIVVGGGNTFHLLDQLYRTGLLDPIRRRVLAGAPYLGWSAGANVACPTICTTNDMPIVMPPGFAALGLVPFQINPHFTDQTIPDHGGETRRQRIEEFQSLNPDVRVVGLREGSGLRLEGRQLTLVGDVPATVFPGPGPGGAADHAPGAMLSFLLRPSSPAGLAVETG